MCEIFEQAKIILIRNLILDPENQEVNIDNYLSCLRIEVGKNRYQIDRAKNFLGFTHLLGQRVIKQFKFSSIEELKNKIQYLAIKGV